MEYFLYAEDKKIEFIESNPKSFENICLNVFRVSYQLELKYQKDLFEFELEELSELMIKLNSKSSSTARVRVRMLYQYIQHFKHLRKDRDNPLYRVETDWGEQFVESNRNIISEEEFEKILSKMANAQDRVFFRLIFEGLYGKNYSELLNLKKDDIDWATNTLRVTDSLKGPREVIVSDKCMAMIKEAIEQKEQLKNDRTGYHKHRYYVDNDYVIKKAGQNVKDTGSHSRVQTKVKLLKEVAKNEDITAKIIQYSGMAYKAIEVSKKYDTPLEKFDLKIHWTEVAKQFNVTAANRGKYIHYWTLWNLFSHNDCQDIKELYGEFEEYKIAKFELVDENETEYKQIKNKRRIDSPKFREWAIAAYKKCAITGEKFIGVLEACHIQPYINEKSNHIQNSLLLRIDIHELFDSGYITIDENYIVHVSPELKSEYYKLFEGKKITLPSEPQFYPSIEALKYNYSIFKDKKVLV